MSTHTHGSPSPEQVRRDALLVATGLTSLALFLAYRAITQHPVASAAIAMLLAASTASAFLARARVKDRIAARKDPPLNGVVIGTVQGDWKLARRRPYSIGWDAFRQHVLVTGPTGRGKTFSFVLPILRAHLQRPNTGVLYMDGKGDRIDQGPDAARFDHVFCPEDPDASARWNPLAGPDPVAAARSFADALYPEAGTPDGNYYEARAAFAIRTVCPAIALTGFEVDPMSNLNDEEMVEELQRRGMTKENAEYCVNQVGVDACENQLRWLPWRDKQDPDALLQLINRKAPPSKAALEELKQPRTYTPTIAALHRVLFTDGKLARLANAVSNRITDDTDPIDAERLALLAREVRSLAELPAKERAATFANLQNRLSVFLTPPFDQLCASSDFTIADVCEGRSIAMLLPAGTFPGIAEPLGRVALAQLQQAVLASTPEVTKLAVLDEFHNFVSPAFPRFLNQARSRGGGAVMCVQSISDFDIAYRDRLLGNASTQIVTPGSMPFDADHWSRVFGEHEIEQTSTTTAPRSILDPAPAPSVRREARQVPRFTPTQVAELGPRQALIHQVRGQTAYPAVVVDVDRRG